MKASDGKQKARREVQARNAGWARRMAAAFASAGVKPNTVSLMSVLFAAASGLCLVRSAASDEGARSLLLVAAVILTLGRLLCNLFDGMMAVEGGLLTKSGEIFNDLPDRVSDAIVMVCAGYAAQGVALAVELGWLAGLLAVMTAYTRMLAGATGAPQRFLGPMAKQHRLAVLLPALIVAAIVRPWGVDSRVIAAALLVIVVGSVVTIARRARATVRDLESS